MSRILRRGRRVPVRRRPNRCAFRRIRPVAVPFGRYNGYCRAPWYRAPRRGLS